MNITVILCTYNRSRDLAAALSSVAASVVPDTDEWEVLVVDNNSSDQTRAVVQEFESRYPGRFRYFFQARQGKSYALNSGIREARGEVLAFMDDDVTVDPAWLRNLIVPLEKGDCVGVGGRIIMRHTSALPHWLSLDGPNSLAGMLTVFDLGDHACELHEAPFGANMAYLKKMFEKYGEFRTDMGPCPGSELRNEDTEFGRRLLAAKERLWYEPSAVVHHPAPARRLTKEYFLSFSFDHGRAVTREKEKKAAIAGIPRDYFTILRYAIASMPVSTLRWLLTFNSKWRFYRKCWVWTVAGAMAELHRRSG